MAPAPNEPWALSGRWIFPIEGSPLERGTITVSGDRIVRVEAHGRAKAAQDLGNVAILPGLVNAHTHLDLTGLRGRVTPGEDFTQWLRAVIRHRRDLSDEQAETDIKTGIAESLRFGTTLVGDISGQGKSWDVLSASRFPLRGVVFHELLGLSRTRAQHCWARACRWLAEHPPTDRCRPGLSPHAPYSVRASLFRAAANRASRDRLPVAIHLAESRAELELLARHGGPFVAFLSEIGVWDADGLAKDTIEVARLNQAVSQLLIAHGNYLTATDVPQNGTVVYCPRTHAAFGHGQHPLREYLAASVRVALGTDSLASNPDLNVLAEARFVHDAFPDIPGERILRMATLSGAEALGWDKETGSLSPGKSADLVVLPLSDDAARDPHELLWKTPPLVSAVLLRGAWVENLPHLEVPCQPHTKPL